MADTPEDEKSELPPMGWLETNSSSIQPLRPVPVFLYAAGRSMGMATAKAHPAVYAPLPDNHEAYSWIGHLASEWAHLELHLDTMIWSLAELPPNVGACITSQMLGHTPRFLAVIALLKHHCVKPGLIEHAQLLLKKAYALAEKRARCVHDAWYFEMVSGTVHQRKSVSRKDVVDEKNLTLKFGIQDTGGLEEIKKTIEGTKKLTKSLATLDHDVAVSRGT